MTMIMLKVTERPSIQAVPVCSTSTSPQRHGEILEVGNGATFSEVYWDLSGGFVEQAFRGRFLLRELSVFA